MALVRTDVDGFGMLRRYECVQCSALGTVEERPDASPAAEKDLKAYGSAQVERGGA